MGKPEFKLEVQEDGTEVNTLVSAGTSEKKSDKEKSAKSQKGSADAKK